MAVSSLNVIRSKYKDALVSQCCEHECRIDLAGLSGHVVLKGEFFRERVEAVCDCIIFDTRRDLTVSLIELKSSSLDADRIKRQFENGSKKVLEAMKSLGLKEPLFVLALIPKKRSRWTELYKIQRTKVIIGSKNSPILLSKCGEKLIDIQHQFLALQGNRKLGRKHKK